MCMSDWSSDVCSSDLGVIPQVTGRPRALASRIRSSARGGDLTEMQCGAGFLDQANVAPDGHRLGDRGGGGEAEARRHLAVGRDGAGGQPIVQNRKAPCRAREWKCTSITVAD